MTKPKPKVKQKPMKKRFRSVSVRHELCLNTAPNREVELEDLQVDDLEIEDRQRKLDEAKRKWAEGMKAYG